VGSQFVHRSFNGGRRYEPISPDLTRNLPNGDVPFSTIKDLSESPLRFGLLYAGADDGRVTMSPDGGYSWHDIPTPMPDKWVSRVVASKHDLATVYVAQNGYRDDDFAAYLWRSADFGKTWTSIAANLPAEPINVIREDPERKDVLYVGTDAGVYVSLDTGRTWEALAGGMPTAPIHDLAIHPREKDLIAASHSRGLWVLPLKWVYAITPAIREADLTVLEAPDVRRNPRWGYDRREPWDSTPPNEPKLSGMFYTKVPGKGTISLLDKDGKTVLSRGIEAKRGFNAIDFSLQIKAGTRLLVAPERKVETVEQALADPFLATRPEYVPVGDYTLRIEVAGKSVRQPWKLTAP
jgi:hypothetical protein